MSSSNSVACILLRKGRCFPLVIFFLAALAVTLAGCRNAARDGKESGRNRIVTSDTILSGMVESLLPPGHSDVTAILPPDQCPGHYDLKLSDIEKVAQADLVVSFLDLAYMEQAEANPGKRILLDRDDNNWMAPDSYISGLNILAGELTQRFPGIRSDIAERRESAIREVTETAAALRGEIRSAGIESKAVIASSLQREPLEWMGLRVIGEYGRPESMSVKQVVELSRIGGEQHAVMVIDNLQSGPDAGRGIAEDIGIPHVILTNFPSEKGYVATLGGNVAAVLAAMRTK